MRTCRKEGKNRGKEGGGQKQERRDEILTGMFCCDVSSFWFFLVVDALRSLNSRSCQCSISHSLHVPCPLSSASPSLSLPLSSVHLSPLTSPDLAVSHGLGEGCASRVAGHLPRLQGAEEDAKTATVSHFSPRITLPVATCPSGRSSNPCSEIPAPPPNMQKTCITCKEASNGACAADWAVKQSRESLLPAADVYPQPRRSSPQRTLPSAQLL